MLSYAGVSLNLLSAEYELFAHTYHSLTDFADSDLWGYDATDIDHLPLPAQPDPVGVEVGTLVWPHSMSRCGYAHYVVSSTRLDRIRTALGEDSAGPADLVMTDGNDHSRTFSMYFVAARPLSVIEDKVGLYLLTLADERWMLRTKTGSVSSTPVSWSALFTTLATALGITLTPDTVHADYGVPTDRWVVFEKPLSVMLDAACNAVGHRLVANLDGTYSTESATTAAASSDFQYADFRKTAGGQFVDADLVRPVPEAVKVLFTKTTAGVPQPDPYSVEVALADLSLTGYDDAEGVPDQSASLVGELVYDGSNAAACTAYAEQAATDFYNWQLIDLDVTFAGVAEWEPTGAEDRVEWKYFVNRILTRVLRGPFQTLRRGGWLTGSESGGVEGPATPTTNSVPVFSGTDVLIDTPLQVQTTATSSTVVQYQVDPPTAGTTPQLQTTVEVDGGDPQLQIVYLPAGTGGDPQLQIDITPTTYNEQLQVGAGGDPQYVFEITETEITHQYQIDPDYPLQYQVTMPDTDVVQLQTGGPTSGIYTQYTIDVTTDEVVQLQQDIKVDGDVQLQVGNEDGTEYKQDQFQIDPADGHLEQIDTTYAMWDGDSVVTKTITTTASGDSIEILQPNGINYTFGGNVTFTGTVTGISTGARTEGTVVAAGTNAATATQITTDAVSVSGGNGTNGVILPNTTAGLVSVFNASNPSGITVYPPTGATFQSGATSITVTSLQGRLFCRASATQWFYTS